jgi:hypothetical protein
MKLRSYFYDDNTLSFVQLGMASNGFTKYYPYQSRSTSANPTSCPISTTASATCFSKYYSSKCYSSAYSSYPAYDARCRTWYQLGVEKANPLNAYFEYPRTSSSGIFVLTGVVPIRHQNSEDGDLYAVLNSNFLASTFSSAINSLQILDSGYSYLIDATNTTYLVMHPKASSSCSRIKCAETFTTDEYRSFDNNVLMVIESQTLTNNAYAVEYTGLPSTYKKDGKTWRLIVKNIVFKTINYALIITVPEEEVLATTTETQNAIKYTVNVMIAVFVISMVTESSFRKLIVLII